MLGHLAAGFELSLYEPHEFLSLFWYMGALFNSQVRRYFSPSVCVVECDD